jgi:hypothetical protein
MFCEGPLDRDGEWACMACYSKRVKERAAAFEALTVPSPYAEVPTPLTTDDLPKAPEEPPVWDLVRADMDAREAFGNEHFGVPFTTATKKDGLREAYEEVLDAALYLRHALYARDGK